MSAKALRPEPAQLARLAEELEATLQGALVQDLRVAGPDLLVLGLRLPGRSVFLGLSLHPEAAGPLLLSERPGRDRAAARGTNFWQLLGAACAATTLERVEAPPRERALLLRLRRGAERRVLAAIFHGARPDLVLLVDGEVSGSLRGRARRGAGEAELLGAPPGRARAAEPPVALETWSRQLAGARRRALAELSLRTLGQRLEKAQAAALLRRDRRLDDLERLGPVDELRRQAEALAANLHRLTRGDAKLELSGWPDPATDPPLCVPLEPARDPVESSRRLWQRLRKAERGRSEASRRADESSREAAALSALLAELQALAAGASAGEEAALEALERLEEKALPLLPAERVRGTARRETPSLPFRRYLSQDGLPILVGRSARANDELTFRVASGNDVWLHARDCPGSHVVLRLPKGAELPQESLLDAATLAHLASRRKGDSHGEVTWCRVKDVSKRKGQPAGQVFVAHERSLRLRVEDERVERLRASEEA